mgnify:CR=1 FL=1
MTINEFYEKYKTNKSYFAPIAGVGISTLNKYAKGEKIRADAKERIEKAMRVAEKYNLVRPEYNSAEGLGYFGMMYKREFHNSVREYKARFKKLIEEES